MEDLSLSPSLTSSPKPPYQNQTPPNLPQFSRHDLHWPRRIFHFLSGACIGFVYHRYLQREQVISILGGITCLLYLLDQIRINYPAYGRAVKFFNSYLLRAEEQLKQSSAVPYTMAVLLCIITFPKKFALLGIFTLAIADPLSAIIGIKFGEHKLLGNKTFEGFLAFWISTTLITFFLVFPVVKVSVEISASKVILYSLSMGILVGLFELIPLKLDDNLTIPLFTSTLAWAMAYWFNFPMVF